MERVNLNIFYWLLTQNHRSMGFLNNGPHLVQTKYICLILLTRWVKLQCE